MKTFDLHDVEAVVKSIANTAIANEKYFSDLDAAAGDADFGVSLATGFKVVLDKWEEYDRSSINAFLLKVSMVITGNVGGSSGPDLLEIRGSATARNIKSPVCSIQSVCL